MKKALTKKQYARKIKALVKRRRILAENKAELQEQEDMEKYRVDIFHKVPPKPASVQNNEVNGLLPFDEGQYHCQEYNDLLKSVIPIRNQFAASTSEEERKALAGEEITHWHDYMLQREKALPDHFKMNSTTVSLLEDVFIRESERRNKTLRSDRVIDFHYKFAQNRRFDVPLDPRNLIQMVHPFHGYMLSIDNKFFTFDEMVKMYRQQLVSSYERSLGQTFLAEELSCLSFWDVIDHERKGYTNFPDFVRVLKMFKFNLNPWTLAAIKQEFEW